VKRTTIYLQTDLELNLKREARRQKRPMADLVRDAIRAYLDESPTRRPPGGGAFASGLADTSSHVDAALTNTDFGVER
jgi:hypothetical protein